MLEYVRRRTNAGQSSSDCVSTFCIAVNPTYSVIKFATFQTVKYYAGGHVYRVSDKRWFLLIMQHSSATHILIQCTVFSNPV